ncbi:hypothetical protein ACFX1X_000776 [Malus domestica]
MRAHVSRISSSHSYWHLLHSTIPLIIAALGYSGKLTTLFVGLSTNLLSSSLVTFSFPFSAQAILIIFIGASEKESVGLSITASSWLVSSLLSFFPNRGKDIGIVGLITRLASRLKPAEAFSSLCGICNKAVCKSSDRCDISLLIKCSPTGCAKTMFLAGISVGDVPWPTSTELPERLTPVDAFCRASASLAGLSGQGLSGKACRAKLVGQG